MFFQRHVAISGVLLMHVLAAIAGMTADERALPEPAARRLTLALSRPLEQRFPRALVESPQTIAGLIVLGGGEERLREAGRLARQWPDVRVFVSGAGAPDYVLRILGAGIAPQRVMIETLSRTTHENALNTKALLGARPGERWLLVTSAIHMPRSIGAFREVGLVTEPWPVFDRPPVAIQATTHEWVGLAYYLALGRGSSLFPGPIDPVTRLDDLHMLGEPG